MTQDQLEELKWLISQARKFIWSDPDGTCQYLMEAEDLINAYGKPTPSVEPEGFGPKGY